MTPPDRVAAPPGADAVNRLGARLARWSLVLGLAIGFAVMLLQISYIYATESEAADRLLDDIERTRVPQLAAAQWQVDPRTVAMMLAGIEELPGVDFIELTDDVGDVTTRGTRPDSVLAERHYALLPPIDGAYAVGDLHVVIGTDDLRDKVLRRSLFALLTLAATLVTSVIALMVLFRREVTDRLAAMARHVASQRFDSSDRPILLPRREDGTADDEIDQLASAFNRMQSRLQDDVRRMKVYEAELSAHRVHLEGLVQARTLELEEKARLLEQQRAAIEQLANTDALTGALSRRHFHELGARELARATRGGHPVAVLALDIDHFKAINDAHGHAGGDAVLRWFAGTCRAQLREADVFGRLGGEEFAVVLPDTGTEAARLVAERIRASIAAAPAPIAGEAAHAVTASLGVAVQETGSSSLEALLLAADEALYAAKRGGRNRVAVSQTG